MTVLHDEAAGQKRLEAALASRGLELATDGDGKRIRWSTTCPQHPRNWPGWRKGYDSGVIIFLECFCTAVSTAGSIAAENISHEHRIGRTLSIFLVVSLYLIGQLTGGIIFPAFSETFGRKRLYVVSTGLYSALCLMVGAVPSLSGVAAARFLSGLLSSIPTTVVAGSIEDMYNSKDRVWMIFVWATVASAGVCLGPILGVYIAASLGWKWIFYVASIITAVLTLLLLGIRESRPSLLLERQVEKLRVESGIHTLTCSNPDRMPDVQTFLRTALFRPIRLFVTEPIVFLVAMIAATSLGLIYLFTEALPLVYGSMGFSGTASTLPLIAIILGFCLGFLTRTYDHFLIARYQREGRTLEPETKLFGFWLAAPLAAIGLWLFAWTIPPLVPGVHWVAPTAGLVLVGFATNEFEATLGGYLADSYLSYAASGFAVLSMVRSGLSAAFPLFATQMFEGLGPNVAASALAAAATVFCVVPPLFARYGKRIRSRSQFAQYSLQVYRENGIDLDGY